MTIDSLQKAEKFDNALTRQRERTNIVGEIENREIADRPKGTHRKTRR